MPYLSQPEWLRRVVSLALALCLEDDTYKDEYVFDSRYNCDFSVKYNVEALEKHPAN
jgi:hypothetical protein